jgi:hypothetical protein
VALLFELVTGSRTGIRRAFRVQAWTGTVFAEARRKRVAVLRRWVTLGLILMALLAGCSGVSADGSGPIPQCSTTAIYAVAGGRQAVVTQNGTSPLTAAIGTTISLNASGDCASSVRLAVPVLGATTAPRYQETKSYTPTQAGTTMLLVLWVPCAPTNGPGPACAPIVYGQIALRSTA